MQLEDIGKNVSVPARERLRHESRPSLLSRIGISKTAMNHLEQGRTTDPRAVACGRHC